MNKLKALNQGDRLFYFFITVILTIFLIIVLYPCIYIVSASFSSYKDIESGSLYLFPKEISLVGYELVFKTKDVWLGFSNSIFYTVVGTLINLVVTMLAAYPLARRNLPGKNIYSLFFAFTMFFSGGMIPGYLVIRSLGLLNTRWVMLLPGAMGVSNMIMARTFIQSNVPDELLEASQMDGCSDFRYLMQVVLPLSKAILAVLTLFYAVGHWNSYFGPMIYLRDKELFPVTIFLRRILNSTQIDPSAYNDPELIEIISQLGNVMKYALIVVTMVPILIVYPFIQKYFVQGVTIGAIKG